jgi:hypothetical protein
LLQRNSQQTEQGNVWNELVVTRNKLINNFAGLVTSGLGPDVACGPSLITLLYANKQEVFTAAQGPRHNSSVVQSMLLSELFCFVRDLTTPKRLDVV